MYIYLLLNIGTLLGPLALSFDKRVAFFRRWKALFPAILITAALFIAWDIFFTEKGVWSFNEAYLIGVNILGLPLEEWLFFFTVPYALVFIYACLFAYFKNQPKSTFHWIIFGILVALMGILLLPNFGKWYSTVCLLFALALLVLAQLGIKAPWLDTFFKAYLISIVPFLLVNGVLTYLPVVEYNPEQFSNIRLISIPVEDLFYGFSLFLMNVLLFEFFMRKMGLKLNTK